jgi:hypothetical protein
VGGLRSWQWSTAIAIAKQTGVASGAAGGDADGGRGAGSY